MLDFRRLQSQLRRVVLARIAAGQMSGSRLARMTDFKQPHITNFLHAKRGLSDEGRDRILRALEISVLDLLPWRELERFFHAGSDTENEAIPVVEMNAADVPLPTASAVRDWQKLKRTMLSRLRTETLEKRGHWLRFVLVRVDDRDAEAMYPRVQRGALLLVDRYYNGLTAYRPGEVNIYVVRGRERMMVRSLEEVDGRVVMRPERSEVPLETMAMDKKKRYAERIVGRVCWQWWEM